MKVRKPTIPFHAIYTKQWHVWPKLVLEKMYYICNRGQMPGGVEADDVMITVLHSKFFIREGTHRCIAMILLGCQHILPQEYRLTVEKKHQDYVRHVSSQFEQLRKRPRTIIELALAYRTQILEAAKDWKPIEWHPDNWKGK